MKEDTASPQIDVSKIKIGSDIAGLFFVLAGMVIFLVGVPLIRYLFAVAIVFGLGVALVLYLTRHDRPSTFRILSTGKK